VELSGPRWRVVELLWPSLEGGGASLAFLEFMEFGHTWELAGLCYTLSAPGNLAFFGAPRMRPRVPLVSTGCCDGTGQCSGRERRPAAGPERCDAGKKGLDKADRCVNCLWISCSGGACGVYVIVATVAR